ncbi:hypothetical protein F511_34674 [Dorcoceras hygrometricum]|uniref:Uncharacterized protein n=1 Tax=Dorcoceras hygrometricum TaxID=472368 RepID=A0A2Z7A647_9LAMI|nr:hypothetical protein F511_34674 [Dorcoceras hygrometricum]
MASSLFTNTIHVDFDSVLAMDNPDSVTDFFQNGSVRDGLVVKLSEIPKDVIFDAKSIVSLSGKPMIIAVTCGVKVNWSSVLFNILKNMVTPATRQAKGYAIQISLLLENVQNLELGESSEFPSSKIMTEKTVHRYIAVTDKVSGENVADVPKVKRTPVKKAVSKKRPAADNAEEIVAVAQEAVPIQIVEATTAAPAEQPPAHKRKSQKRKRRLVMPQGSDDDVFEQPAAEGAGETAVESVPVETTVDVPMVESAVEEPVFESEVTEPAVDPVVVLVETAQLGATETVVGAPKTQEDAVEQHWFDLPYEDIIAKLNDRPVVTPSDTDEEVETMDVGKAVRELNAKVDAVSTGFNEFRKGQAVMTKRGKVAAEVLNHHLMIITGSGNTGGGVDNVRTTRIVERLIDADRHRERSIEDSRLLRQTPLEVLTRSARSDSPRKVGRKQVSGDNGAATAAARGGDGGGGVRVRREAACAF